MHKPRGKRNIVVSLLGLAVVGSFMFLMERDIVPIPSPRENPSRQSPFLDNPGYQSILSLQEAFVRNAREVGPAVVSISKLQKIQADPVGYDHVYQQPKSWFLTLKRWLKNWLDQKYQMEDVGAGLILNQKGHILTNWHILEGADQLKVKLSNGKRFTARIVGFDFLTDLAVLKIFSFGKLPTAPLGRSKDLEIGEWVMAIGNPYGLNGTVSVGVVSGIDVADWETSDFDNLIHTDAAISSGGSGGPLINTEGKIVGINTAYADLNVQRGFTIPIEQAIQISDQLIRNGGVERGWLGVGIQSMTPELAASFNLSHLQGGVLVNTVEDKAPAKHEGLKRGDIIIRYDGKLVSHTNTLQKWVAKTQVGKSVPVGIIRNGTETTLRVVVGRMGS